MKSLHHHNLIQHLLVARTSIIIHSTESFSHSVMLPSGFHYYLLHLLPDLDFCLFISFGFSLRGLTFFRFRLPFSTSLRRPLVLTHIPRPSVSNKIPSLCFIRAPNHSFPLCSLSSLCRVCLPRFVHVWDADQDVRSGHPALLPFLIQLLRLCGECTNSHTETKCKKIKVLIIKSNTAFNLSLNLLVWWSASVVSFVFIGVFSYQFINSSANVIRSKDSKCLNV